jgi:hypothetical protein
VLRAFLIHRVRAQNVAVESANKIHDDQVAATYGFRGGLVPGVTVYGYMTDPIIEMAPEWLERGSMALRLIEPFYDGEEVLVQAERGKDGLIAVTAEREDGTVCARGTASIRGGSSPQPQPLPEHPLPATEQRSAPSSDNVIPGELLGTVVEPLDLTGRRPYTERLLQYSNDILARNFKLGPWIHTASEIDNWGVAREGDRISARGRVQERFDRKGHEFVVLDVTLVDGERLIQTVRHTAIYKPRRIDVTPSEYSANGVDLTLIRWMLSLTPAERLQVLQRFVNSVEEIRACNDSPTKDPD